MRVLLALLSVSLLVATTGPAEAKRSPFLISKRLKSCEMPNVFYSAAHVAGQTPCCPTAVGVCAGGIVCPGSGVCPDGKPCVVGPPPNRPNFVLMIPDDLGDCHYGHAGECRSVQTGTPIPAPKTPNLDALAGFGTVFPTAHNASPWCFPSLTTILTGRYQRSMEGQLRSASVFGTIATSLRSLDNSPSVPNDPYHTGNKFGGYCTLLGGKLSPSIGENGFDARTTTGERVLGRVKCAAVGPGQAPICGSDMEPPGTYDPRTVFHMGDLFAFLDRMLYRVPGSNPAQFRNNNFFVWYAPRIPHQPLRSPLEIREYLFGSPGTYPLGGLFDLGSLCSGGNCPPTVTAFNENNFGTVYEMFGNVWWMDTGLREIRKFLARQSAPHCIKSDGTSNYAASQPNCTGTWASSITPSLADNTIIVTIADNGWHLPSSKHQFTENGYNSRLIVFDPRALPSTPNWDTDVEPTPPAQESKALAHAVDIHTTLVGYALDSTPGSQLCPIGSTGSRCDGKDLRPHLLTTPGGPAAPESFRHSLCGHDTKRSSTPEPFRYLVTRDGSVGRCTNLAATSCVSDANCTLGELCIGGHCMTRSHPSCTADADCPVGGVCLGLECRVAPPCIEDADCGRLFPGGSYACVEKTTHWCRNDLNVKCNADTDCPVCPLGGACGRLCEPRRFKFYFAPTNTDKAGELSDLFIDPDETGVHEEKINSTKLLHQMSALGGPYGDTIRRANCCVDDWWADPAAIGTLCAGGCPADLTCNQ